MNALPNARRPRNRAALLAQLPARVGELRQRGEHLARDGWDINAMWLLANDAEALADASARLGDEASSKQLVTLADCLWPLLDLPALPDAEAMPHIAAALSALASTPDLATDDDGPGEEATLFGYAASEDNGYPLLLRPPAQYWRRFAGLRPVPAAPTPVRASEPPPLTPAETAPLPPPEPLPAPKAPVAAAAAPPAAVTATPITTPAMPPAEAAPASADDSGSRIALHLGDGSPLAADLDLKLRATGHDLRSLRDPAELKNLLSRITPALVVLTGQALDGVEEIGALVQAARARSSRRLVWIMAAAQTDLAARLRVMRAGCDALVALPAPVSDVIARIEELGDAARADPYRVMIVEDDRSQAMFAESILRKSGMQTLIVAEAAAVLDQLDDFAPDLVLMDLHMPECDGIELTALIREREAHISTPIVFLSGESDTDRHFDALSAGGDDFLSKPIAPKHLIAAVGSRVRRARQLARRRTPGVREAARGVHDIVTLTHRLADLLAMEDAATRNGGLLFVEIEDGQRVHGRIGTPAFEALVEAVMTAAASRLGAADMLARCGDSGFLILNPAFATRALVEFARELREQVSHTRFNATDENLRIGIVVGICPFTAAAGDAKAMTEAAERAMLEARLPGRDGIHVHEAPAGGADGGAIVSAIRQALETSAFRVVFQPIVSLRGEEEEQFQALLRLPAGDHRMYAASELVPAAERAGLIAEVDRWVLGECIRTISERLHDGHRLRLFASQSLASVRETGRIDWLRQQLDQHRVPAAQLVLELRMDDAVGALQETVAFCLALKQLGVGAAISGFDAGMRGNELLRHLPVDFVKLSARYAHAHDEAVRSDLRELVRVARESGRRVIAPRVEDARAAAALWSGGVDLIQGNFVQQAERDLSYDFHTSAV